VVGSVEKRQGCRKADDVIGRQKISFKPCQIGNEEEEKQFVAAVRQWAPEQSFFALINNAGISAEGILATFPNVDSARVLEVNLLGALTTTEVFLDQLKDGEGDLVNISSVGPLSAGIRPWPYWSDGPGRGEPDPDAPRESAA